MKSAKKLDAAADSQSAGYRCNTYAKPKTGTPAPKRASRRRKGGKVAPKKRGL